MVVAGVLCHAMSKLWQSSPKKLQKIDRVSYQTDLQILVMTSHFSDSFVLAGHDLPTSVMGIPDLHMYTKVKLHKQTEWALPSIDNTILGVALCFNHINRGTELL